MFNNLKMSTVNNIKVDNQAYTEEFQTLEVVYN